MLLVIDIGNTNIVIGVYKEDKLLVHWRIFTEHNRTCDEYGITFFNLYSSARLDFKDTTDIIISCVVPPVLNDFEELCLKYFHIKPLIVGPGIKTGMPILYDNPKEVGADRIVNAVAAYEKYKHELIIIDFGTATTFDYISAKGEYLGGAIAPGIMVASEALFQKASKLPSIEIIHPQYAVGKDTVKSIQAGLFFGYVGLVDGIVEKMCAEMKSKPRVIATGGLARLIGSESKTINFYEELLTLEGLKIIWGKNRS
ncbi:MAG: type III pantothenate kinase [Thermodesulfobacteriota bacterium]|nr:type III pantothenate kinase [Thermodesulfobacteriota bacterium]